VLRGGEGDAFFGVADRADVVGMDVDVLRVGRGDLKSIEQEAGAFGIELVGGEGLEDFDERELDGGAVFNGGQFQRGTAAFLGLVEIWGTRFGCAADGTRALADGFLRWGESAVMESGLEAGGAAAAGDLLLLVEAAVVVAPVAVFNRCRTAAVTTRSYVSALEIHSIFLLRLRVNSAGHPPPLWGEVHIALVEPSRFEFCGEARVALQRS
jgi:hypothetical protein